MGIIQTTCWFGCCEDEILKNAIFGLVSGNKNREGFDLKYDMKTVSELHLRGLNTNQVPIKNFLKDDMTRYLNYPITKSIRNLDFSFMAF